MEGGTLEDSDCVARIDAAIASMDFTPWVFRLTGTGIHTHKPAPGAGKRVAFMVLAAALLNTTTEVIAHVNGFVI
jgi:hypothetical protein